MGIGGGLSGVMQADFFRDQNEREEIAKIEQLKRLGRNFIRVHYTGRSQAPRFHGLEEVRAYQYHDTETGTMQWRTSIGQGVPAFRGDGIGNIVADVLDTEHNRFWLSRHIPSHIEIPDKQMRKEVIALRTKPYKVEKSRREELESMRTRIEDELQHLSAVEGHEQPNGSLQEAASLPQPQEPQLTEPMPAAQPTPPRRRGRPRGSKNRPKAGSG